MKIDRRAVLFLLFLAPMTGELLSSSAPPAEFFSPFGMTFLVALYGCGALLIRDRVRRLNKGWPSIILLGLAYGIFEEGIVVRSFFDPSWTDLGSLGVYGRWLGVNWVWTINLMIYHAFVSIGLPILVAELLFPAQQHLPWLGKWSSRFCWFFFLVTAPLGPLFGMQATPWMLLGCVLAILGLDWLARHWPDRPSPAPVKPAGLWRIGFSVFGWMILHMLLMWILPGLQLPAIIAFFAPILLLPLGLWIARRLGAASWTARQRWACALGGLLPWMLVGVLAETQKATRADNTTGMTLVALVYLVFMLWLGWRIRRQSGISPAVAEIK